MRLKLNSLNSDVFQPFWSQSGLLGKVLGCSEAWGTPQFQEKRSRSEKAILGALGESWGILRAALGIRNSSHLSRLSRGHSAP